MIYLILSGNYIKIGYSSDFKKRLLQYITCNPNFEILDTYEEGEKKDESNLHIILKEFSYKGEWMYYNDDIIKTWNNYTGHTINTLKEIKQSEFEKEISRLTKRMLEAEEDRDIAKYQKYFILNNLSNLYKQSNNEELISYIKELVNKFNS